MRILIACEESQKVCIEMRAKGHECYSCDIEPCSGNHPEWHIQQDVLPLLNGYCKFQTADGQNHSIEDKWDLIIAHPPCTYLSCAGNRWFNVEKYGDKAKERIKLREEAKKFFMAFVNADCEKIAIENPVGVMSSYYRKPDCIIQPWQFGHNASKKTCFWLKNLQPLQPTNIMPENQRSSNQLVVDGKLKGFMTKDKNGKLLPWGSKETKRLRSQTFEGIAKAMAEQWT